MFSSSFLPTSIGLVQSAISIMSTRTPNGTQSLLSAFGQHWLNRASSLFLGSADPDAASESELGSMPHGSQYNQSPTPSQNWSSQASKSQYNEPLQPSQDYSPCLLPPTLFSSQGSSSYGPHQHPQGEGSSYLQPHQQHSSRALSDGGSNVSLPQGRWPGSQVSQLQVLAISLLTSRTRPHSTIPDPTKPHLRCPCAALALSLVQCQVPTSLSSRRRLPS